MKCKNCGSDIHEVEKAYKCEGCGLTIWKVISGHKLTESELHMLLEKGETGTITFISKDNHRPYKARLVIRGSKVGYDYQNNDSLRSKLQHVLNYDKQPDTNTIRIRVESQQPGAASLTIRSDCLDYQVSISFGLTSTRECECLSIVAAAVYIQHHVSDFKEKSLFVEVNSQEVANYLLKETKPRDKQMQFLVFYTWGQLGIFKACDVVYKQRKKTKLVGTNVSRYYPKGLFPGIEKLVAQDNGGLFVYLPANPAICKQFLASFPRATVFNMADTEGEDSPEEEQNELETFVLSPEFSSKVDNWFSIVTDINK